VIGGADSDTITAVNRGDILISGRTAYDGPSVDKSALLAMLAEWQRTDADYVTRINHLRNGNGLNNGNVLALGSTVFHDGTRTINFLHSSPATGEELDWFFASNTDNLDGQQTGEQVN
jgi:hypothetical protein